MGTGEYEADLLCEWTIECPDQGSHVSLSFTQLDTEENYDTVAIFDGGRE